MTPHGQSPPMGPTWRGRVSTTLDALMLFEACLQGVLTHVPRRPHDRERDGLVKSGCVVIYEEHSSGIKRWTDGFNWSPSRILGNFLIYRELECAFPPGEKKRARKPKKSGNGPSKTAESARAAAVAGGGGSNGLHENDTTTERSLIGSLVDSYPFKEDGLVKKTISVTWQGVTHHLVSYYTVQDVLLGKLICPGEHEALKTIVPRPELFNQQSFRNPVTDQDPKSFAASLSSQHAMVFDGHQLHHTGMMLSAPPPGPGRPLSMAPGQPFPYPMPGQASMHFSNGHYDTHSHAAPIGYHSSYDPIMSAHLAQRQHHQQHQQLSHRGMLGVPTTGAEFHHGPAQTALAQTALAQPQVPAQQPRRASHAPIATGYEGHNIIPADGLPNQPRIMPSDSSLEADPYYNPSIPVSGPGGDADHNNVMSMLSNGIGGGEPGSRDHGLDLAGQWSGAGSYEHKPNHDNVSPAEHYEHQPRMQHASMYEEHKPGSEGMASSETYARQSGMHQDEVQHAAMFDPSYPHPGLHSNGGFIEGEIHDGHGMEHIDDHLKQEPDLHAGGHHGLPPMSHQHQQH